MAIHFVGEPDGDTRDITYAELHEQVQQAANALQDLGVGKGDTVAIYLPMIPEAAVAMLACARIGAPHSVVFGGFSAEALYTRINDAKCKLVITSDGGYRRGSPAALKPAVDAALAKGETTVEHVLVVKRTGQDTEWNDRDVWWHEALDKAADTHEAQGMEAEHPLFILYTSGTTGKPKGIFHTTGGYLTQAAYTNSVVHDVHPETDVYWCTADIGWVTGHSYIVYGPHGQRCDAGDVRGDAGHPAPGPLVGDRREVQGDDPLHGADGDPDVHEVGRGDPAEVRPLVAAGARAASASRSTPRRGCGTGASSAATSAPIVDTWWQTETGAIMISPLPGVTALKPGSAQRAIPGISVDVVDDEAKSVPDGGGGYLVIDKPWPSMLRGIWGDPERYQETYWSRFDGLYFAGDGAKKDDEGNIWLLGRVDDVMNVSGHRLSTTEIESALVSHPKVAEAAVVGRERRDDGSGGLRVRHPAQRGGAGGRRAGRGRGPGQGAAQPRRVQEIGPIAKPRQIMIVKELPKTRSGKIMRRLLRDVAENREVGDVTTLADSSVMDLIKEGLSTGKSED